MSMATYIGFNFPVEIQDDYTENEIDIIYFFSVEENRQIVQAKHFTTPYVYEIETKGEPIWQMHNENKVSSPHNYEKAKKTFLHVCDFLKNFLSKGDYCEIYICWIGEEGEDHEKKFELSLYQLPVDEVEIDEKCLMMLRN
ncbi:MULTISPECIES: hypothetical protein [Lysinibacillus]|uniref:hypothetical protein n=1 Tax=Lysinibacillus TaxID=400634 RepID=UPI001C8C2361|nr:MULTISPECIES: hypothetical protein [Lysinibacillus]MBX8946718.1 hypothetical protein [Lysinibacillus sp. K60]